jgi:putative acetyltransferase
MDAITLRTAEADDYDALGEIMFDAIHNGPTHYTVDESNAWAPALRSGAEWASRLEGKTLILAERGATKLGFMSIEPGGYIDFAYIRPQSQGSGLFRQLFNQVLAHARKAGESQLSTHASLMAQPAFVAMGFEINVHETVEISGQKLARAQMKKSL